jgi:plastocyanin
VVGVGDSVTFVNHDQTDIHTVTFGKPKTTGKIEQKSTGQSSASPRSAHRTLALIWRAYGVQLTAQAGDHVDHTLYTLLLDRSGRGRVLYDSTASSPGIAHDVRLLLGRG